MFTNTVMNTTFRAGNDRYEIDTADLTGFHSKAMGFGYETMIFVNGEEDGYVRTDTLDKAIEAHHAMVEKRTAGLRTRGFFEVDYSDLHREEAHHEA